MSDDRKERRTLRAIADAGVKADAPPAFWRFVRDAAEVFGASKRAAEAARRARQAQ